MGAVAKSYMRKGFLIYEEMRKYLVIYEEAVSHIWLCNRSLLDFLIYEEKFVFVFISVTFGLIGKIRSFTLLRSSLDATLQQYLTFFSSFDSPPPPSHTHLFKVYTQAYGLLFVHIFMLMTTGIRPLYAFAVQYHVNYCTYTVCIHEYSSQILSPWLGDIVDYGIGLSYRHIRQPYAQSGTNNLATEHIPTKISKTLFKFSKQKLLFYEDFATLMYCLFLIILRIYFIRLVSDTLGC